jgi:hypothetical protein
MNGRMSGFRRSPLGIKAVPMSDNVSDLVFRDLDPDIPASRTFDDKWEASLREELEKLRPVRPAPRVLPAADTGDRQARSGR